MWWFLLIALVTAQETVNQTQTLIEEVFAAEISSVELEMAAVQAMIQNIEAQTGLSGSAVFSTQEHKRYLAWQQGLREGYGLRVQMLPGTGYFVESVVSKGPAEKAGIERGDVIVALADYSFSGLPAEQMLVILNQEYENLVPIKVLRHEELRQYDLEKGPFQIQLLSQEKALNIHFFGKGLSNHLRMHLEEHQTKPLVIDLRDNEGGVWEEAIAAIDYFIPSGEVICYRRTMDGVAIPILSKEAALHTAPVIVLINQGTVGPAELFALSLQEHKRVTVLGVSSAGEASDFRTFSIQNDIVLKLVDTEILSPQKRSWTGQGVEPNIVIRQNIALPAYGSSTTDMQLETALRLLSTSQ